MHSVQGDASDSARRLSGGFAPRLPTVHLISSLPQTDLPQLYASVDAFTLASRGEGWGRPHAEAMACGLPVVATTWGGTSEFVNDANAYPVPVLPDLREVPAESAFRGHRYAEPDVAAMRTLLHRVVEHQHEAAARAARARADMVELYGARPIAAFVRHQLLRLGAAARAAATRGSEHTGGDDEL